MSYEITLELPSELYQQIQDLAGQRQMSVQSALIETIRLHFAQATLSQPAPEWEILEIFPDDLLMSIVHMTDGIQSAERLATLTEAAESRTLLSHELLEVRKLSLQATCLDAIRAKASSELNLRGYALDDE